MPSQGNFTAEALSAQRGECATAVLRPFSPLAVGARAFVPRHRGRVTRCCGNNWGRPMFITGSRSACLLLSFNFKLSEADPASSDPASSS